MQVNLLGTTLNLLSILKAAANMLKLIANGALDVPSVTDETSKLNYGWM